MRQAMRQAIIHAVARGGSAWWSEDARVRACKPTRML